MLLVMPILVRIYDPAAFGAFSVFLTGVTTLSSVASTRYEQAIVLARSSRAAVAVIQLAFFVAILVCSASAVFLLFVGSFLDTQFKVALGSTWILGAALALPLSFLTTLTMISVRYERYTLISALRGMKLILSGAAQVTIGVSFLPGVSGLIAGEFLGNATTACICLFALRQLHKRTSRRFDWFLEKFLWREMIVVAKKFFVFPVINTPQVLANGLFGWTTILVMSSMFSADDVGFYYLTQKVAMAPASLAGQAVSQVYYREASTAAQCEGIFYRPLLRVIAIQMLIGVPFAFILFFFGSEIFSLAFGAEWRRAGRFAEILAPYVAVHLVLASLAHTTIVAGRQSTMLFLSVIQNFVFVGGFIIGAMDGGTIETGIRGAMAISVLYMLGIIAWYVKLAKTPHRVLQ
jgi:O-antigen/teichoic acid export membrane protein